METGYYGNKIKGYTRAFVNPLYGNDLAQDGSFGAAFNIYDGGDNAGWTPSVLQGTWDMADTVDPFSGTFCFSIAGATNGDSVEFSGAAIDTATYTAITLEIKLEAYDSSRNSILVEAFLLGDQVGNTYDANISINPDSLGSYQNAVILLESGMGMSPTDSFDEIRLTIVRTGGTAPSVRFDELLAQEENGGIDFNMPIDSDKNYSISSIEFSVSKNIVGDLARDPDTLLGVALTNGLVINRVEDGVFVQGRNISSLSEFKDFRFRTESWDDGVNKTSLIIAVEFKVPLIVNGTKGDSITINVQDDLTSFSAPNGSLRAVATGGVLTA